MKGKISKRLLSLILAVIMVVSVVPMGVFTASAAGYVFPVASSGGYYVSSKYGVRTYKGITSNHYGVDIASYGGAALNIVSVTTGKVISISNSCGCNSGTRYKCAHYGTYGNMVVVQNDDGTCAYYGHLKKDTIAVTVGERVAAGQKLALMGTSGYSSGVHLHFELRTYYGAARNWNNCKNVNTDAIAYQYLTKPIVKDDKPPIPATPSGFTIDKTSVPVDTNITISWAAANGAYGYILGIRGAEHKDIDVGSTTNYAITLSASGKYEFYVRAYNISGQSAWTSALYVTAHNPSTVTFVDWDGKQLGKFDVPYGGNATAPAIPYREGYTFRQWSDSYYNVTSDKTITAIYKINTYTVNFRGYKGDIISTQRVDYGNNATPPDPQTPNGYIFLGWNSEDYKNVYTEDASKTIDIQGIYQWANKELPIVCTITSAKRQDDGYYVYFDLENKIDEAQKGRAVVALKTSSGKLVDMTESAAFSIAKNSTKSGIEVFIPSSSAASKVEVIIVADYATGVPISPLSTCNDIDSADMWSDWSDIKPTTTDVEVEDRTVYRYSDKEFSTGNTKTKSGWNYAGTYTENVGSWSGWQDSYIAAIQSESLVRQVQTQSVTTYTSYPQYNYYRYAAQYSGGYSSVGWTSSKPNAYFYTFDSELAYGGTSSDGTPWYKWYYNGSSYCAVYRCGTGVNTGGTFVTYKQVATGTKTQYRYLDTTYTYNFYRWKDWSDWSETAVTATDNRQVETKTQYRTMGAEAGVENDTGTWYTQPVDLPATLANKQVTLSVYGYTGASDYTNFYIGQQQLDSNGDCTFEFKLREELSLKTGNLTVAIGVEGTDYMQVIDILEAPKPEYTVKFYDWYGNVISEQTVTEGEDAVLPETPEMEGYTFIGWDKSITNIKADTEIYADYEKKEYTVVFVDWQNQFLEVQTYEHGDILIAPEVDTINGYTFNGWDKVNDGNIVVTQDMVVYAEYKINEYTVNFYDFDGNVINTQVVKFGDEAEEPEVPDGENGEKFAGWFNPEDYVYVDGTANIYPSFYFEETTPIPEANYISGEYDGAIELTLTTDDENAVIYYYFGDDQSTEAIYTGPITIDKSTTFTYYATSFGKNDSESVTGYYCINSDDVSGWMLQSELPANVTANPDDYVVESAKGYRYKNTQTTSSISVGHSLLMDGWAWLSGKWSDYTAWQDQKITNDGTLIDFTVETREVDDTSVTWYKYTRYKYTDLNGTVQYSPTAVDGYDCTEETLRIPDKLSIAGFLDDDITTYYEYNGERWFTRTSAPGLKTQYRSRYKICTYYKWTEWGTTAPASGETRVYETDTIYRYSVQNYHIVDIVTGFGDMPLTSIVKSGTVYDTSALETEGYTFDGLYTDEALATAFGATTPITESVTLYAKYTPKKYTVRFQTQDGTEVETQQVEYFTAATEPDVDAVPNYTFVSWDKDFDCITGDTVVTGKYIKTAEYAYINLDRTSADMYQGTSFSLIPTITPSDLANEVIEWSTSDPSIAIVDDKGNVTAVAAGEVTITATVVKSREKASCTISVAADKANFIVLKSDTYLGYDSLGYLRGVKLNTTTSTLSREFTNATLKYKNMSGTELGENSLIGTGSTIMLYNGSTLVDSKVAIVTGDMTGDGIINNRDVVMMNKYLLNKVEAQECQTIATDVNGDGYVNNKDAAMVARYMVGKENF